LRGFSQIPILFGLTLIDVALWCCCRIIPSILERLLMVVEGLDDDVFGDAPREPFSREFGQLLEVFKTIQRIHCRIELNLVVGANYALGWVQKWHSKLNFNTMSRDLPPPQRSRAVPMQVHMDATLEPARMMITKLLEADTGFF
jgi:hypothetical protein